MSIESLTLTQSSCLRERANACSARFRFFDCWARMLWVEVRLSRPRGQGGHMVVGSTYLFQGLVHNVSSRCDLFLLTDSVDAVQCLVLYHGVPLRLHEEDVVCSGQIQSRGVSDNVTGFGQCARRIRGLGL